MIQAPTLAPTPTTTKQPLERQEVVNLVRKWGDLNTDGILDSSCDFFFVPEVDGLIGYRIGGGNAVVFGDPICAQADKPKLAHAFQQNCQANNLGVVYTMASRAFVEWAIPNLSAAAIEFGEKLVLDPSNNPMNRTGSKAGLVRKKVKHALAEGFVVEEYTGNDHALEQAIEAVADQWLHARNGPQIYLAHVSLFNDRPGKRWFYAHKDGKVAGLLMLNALEAQQGWLLNNLMVTKDAPNGISELLVISTLQALEKEQCKHVVIGPIPAKSLGAISGLSAFNAQAARFVYTCARKLFKLDGQGVFWDKFQPASESSYLLFPQRNLSYSSVKDLLLAYNARFS